MLFLSADIISEFGVSSSSTCSPQRRYGDVTISDMSTISDLFNRDKVTLKQATMFSQMQTIPFIEGDFSMVRSGFPADVNANVCTKCLDTPDHPVILGDCTVLDGRTYGPGELLLGVEKISSLLRTVSVGFKETSTKGTAYLGTGDVVKQHNCTIFSFHMPDVNNTSNATLTYFEYANDTHCEEILDKSRADEKVLWIPTEGFTYTQEIRCSINSIQAATFRDSVSFYRSLMLEYSLHRAGYNTKTHRFRKLTADDVLRSAIAAMLTNGHFEEKDYFEYSDCGLYSWVYITPFLALLILLSFAAGIVSLLFQKRPAPYILPVLSPSQQDDLDTRL